MVYCIAILAFEFADDDYVYYGEEEFPEDYLHEVQLKDQHNRIFYRKLKYIFIETPRFNKTATELLTRKDKWIYFLKNLEDFNEIPAILNEPIFQEAFEVARVANFDNTQLDAYEESLKNYRDLHNVVTSAENKTADKVKKETIIRIIKSQKVEMEDIAIFNDVPLQLVLNIQKEINKGEQ